MTQKKTPVAKKLSKASPKQNLREKWQREQVSEMEKFVGEQLIPKSKYLPAEARKTWVSGVAKAMLADKETYEDGYGAWNLILKYAAVPELLEDQIDKIDEKSRSSDIYRPLKQRIMSIWSIMEG